MRIKMFILFFVFFVAFLQFTDGQTCDSKNKIGTCVTLTCPLNCTKSICNQPEEKSNVANPLVAAYITGPLCGLLLLVIVVFVTMKYIRSRRNADNRSNLGSLSSKRNSTAVDNRYSPRRRYPGPPKTPMPHFFPVPDDDENKYDNYYEPIDIQGKDNPIKVPPENGESASGYLIPNSLNKPNFPPPQVPDSPTE